MSRWLRLLVIMVEWFISGMVLLVVRCGSRVVSVVLVVVLIWLCCGVVVLVLVVGWVVFLVIGVGGILEWFGVVCD